MASMSRLPRHLRLGLLPVAALFFFNPLVAIIDPLPDCIGYILLWFALGYAADLHTYLGEARSAFLRMAGIDALKLAGLLFLLTIPSTKEQPSTQLLLTFVFGVLELIYAIPAWNNFFDGIYGLISGDGDLRRYDLIVRQANKKHPAVTRSLPELLKGGMILWIICRAVLTTLPEMTALSSFDYEGYVTNFDIDIYSFRGLFVLLAVLIMAVIGLFWLIRMLRMTVRLYRDEALLETLRDRYTVSVMPDTGLFLRRRIRLGLGLATLAAALSVDFYVEELNVIPDSLAAVVLIVSILVLRGAGKRWMPALWASGVWAVLSLTADFFARAFHGEYYPALVYKNSGAYAAYQLMCTTTLIEQLGFAAAIICFGILLTALIRSLGQSVWEELRGKVIGWYVLGLAAAVSGVAYDLLLPAIEFIWLIDFGIGLFFAGYVWKTFGDIYETLALCIRDGQSPHERNDLHVYLH